MLIFQFNTLSSKPALFFLLSSSFQFIFSFKWLELNWSQVKWFETKSKLLFFFFFSQDRIWNWFFSDQQNSQLQWKFIHLILLWGKNRNNSIGKLSFPIFCIPHSPPPFHALSLSLCLSFSITYLLKFSLPWVRTHTHVCSRKRTYPYRVTLKGKG